MKEAKTEDRRLNKGDLSSTSATAALGLIVAKHLLENKIATIYLDKDGYVVLAQPGELGLDALPEPMAVQTLSDRGYGDEDLEEYLRGRDARLNQ